MTLRRGEAEVHAANAALAHLSEGRLADLSENRPAAQHVREHFGLVRDACLRLHPWRFAMRRRVLMADPAAERGGFSLTFRLPADCLRVVEVDGLDEDSWAVATRGGSEDGESELVQVLETDHPAPNVAYVARIGEPALWDPMFTEFFALRLAAAIAPLVGRGDDADDLEARASVKLAQARRVNAREAARSSVTRSPSFVAVRW